MTLAIRLKQGVKRGIMKVIKTGIKDLLIIEPQVFGDNRGWFFEAIQD